MNATACVRLCRNLLSAIPESERDEILQRKGVNHIQELVQGSEPMPGRRGFVDTVSIPQNDLCECELGMLVHSRD